MRRITPLMALLLIGSQLQSTAYADDVGATDAAPAVFDQPAKASSQPPVPAAEKSAAITPAPMTTAPPPPHFWNMLPEVMLRPIGMIGLMAGSVAFIVASPFTYAATYDSPDAMSHSYNGFIAAPIRYTFDRPLGDYRFPVFETPTDQKMPSEVITQKTTSKSTQISRSTDGASGNKYFQEAIDNSPDKTSLDQAK